MQEVHNVGYPEVINALTCDSKASSLAAASCHWSQLVAVSSTCCNCFLVRSTGMFSSRQRLTASLTKVMNSVPTAGRSDHSLGGLHADACPVVTACHA